MGVVYSWIDEYYSSALAQYQARKSSLHDVRLVFQHSGLVGVYVQVVWGGEDGHDGWETCRLGFTVHSISNISPVSPLHVEDTSEKAKRETHPASWASCARMMDNKLFLSRKLQAAVYLLISPLLFKRRVAYVKKKLHPLTWLCMKESVFFSFPKSSTGSAHRRSHINPEVGGSLNRLIYH